MMHHTAVLSNTFDRICVDRIVNPKIVFHERAHLYLMIPTEEEELGFFSFYVWT